MEPKLKHTSGFSLIELLFAMVFLSVIVFGVIKLQTSNLTLSNTKQLELKAYFYAAQALEIVDALGYAEVSTCVNPCYLSKVASTYSLEDLGVENLETDLFQRTILHNIALPTDVPLVTAHVEWTDSSGLHTIEAKKVIFN